MEFRGTTIIAVKKDGKTVIAGDGQVTFNQNVVLKGNAVKVRRIFKDQVVVGFAGSVADAFSLSDRFEKMLNKFSGNLMRSAVELAQLWRTDKAMRQLEAMLLVADKDQVLLISGTGEVIEPEHGVIAIGSGGNYARSAGKALLDNTNLSAREIALKAMQIASEICIFTNNNFVVEEV